jgi:negative regulator of flagellin synthesis FlgM
MVDEISTSAARFGTTQAVRFGSYSSQGGQAQTTSESSDVTDTVEISDLASLRAKYSQLPEIRQDLVDQVRNEIASGTYETPEKLDQAIESLIEDLL